MENDVRASQQYLGSINLTLLEDLIKQWNKLQHETKWHGFEMNRQPCGQ
jgi:hypothetical protein